MSETTGYDGDFYAWANEQAALLRAGRLAALDIENIADELESMSRSEKRELVIPTRQVFASLGARASRPLAARMAALRRQLLGTMDQTLRSLV